MEWLIGNWLGIVGIVLTLFFGLVGAKYYSNKNSKVSQNHNLGNGNQYNAGRDINLKERDKK